MFTYRPIGNLPAEIKLISDLAEPSALILPSLGFFLFLGHFFRDGPVIWGSSERDELPIRFLLPSAASSSGVELGAEPERRYLSYINAKVSLTREGKRLTLPLLGPFQVEIQPSLPLNALTKMHP